MMLKLWHGVVRMASINQVVADIKILLKKNNQDHLHRNVRFADIPIHELDILFSYLSVQLICKLYGGNFAQQVKSFNARAIEESVKLDTDDESQFEPQEPSGIGDWKYADRIKQKVFRSLEGIINQSAATVSHNQYVQAAKALLDQADKTKLDAAEIMMAYESQLLVLAEHLVESFLPELGQLIKQELREVENAVVKKIVETSDPDMEHVKIWKDEIDKVVRSFELKRYELLLAETMSLSQQVSAAFDFSRDLIDNYKMTSEIIIENKNTTKLKQHIGKRK